jgi:hypothetical protein
MSSAATKKIPPAPVHDPAIVQKHLDDGAKGQAGRAIPDVPLAEHVNHTSFPSQYFQSVDQEGNVYHVVVLRVTYAMNAQLADGSLAYANEQTPLATKDEWSGEVNDSSPLWESDYCPFKPRCDVLVVNAVSRPPHNQAAQRWPCGVALKWEQDGQAQTWAKQLAVTGPRQFGMLGLGRPELASEVPIDWQRAFGGQIKQPEVDEHHADGSVKKAAGSQRWDTDERNPVGAGFNKASGQPGPQLEVFDQPYTDGLLQGDYPPVGLSAVGKAWLPRRVLAGTYDNDWLKDQWPLPPMDFDDGYWNCAPQDQQVSYLPPGTQILLMNLHPPTRGEHEVEQAAVAPNPKTSGPAASDTWQGKLPMHQVWLGMVAQFGDEESQWLETPMNLDTLVMDLAAQQIYATYRLRLQDHSAEQLRLLELRTAITRVGQPEKTLEPEDFGPLWL